VKGILLDTNVFLWYINGDERLSVTIRETIENNPSFIMISIASIWEIGLKHAKGNLVLNGGFHNFIFSTIVDTGITIMPITVEHIETSISLPFHHSDPFDRIIIAQSKSENIELLYTDSVFKKYIKS